MTRIDLALERAHGYWDAGSGVPMDLFCELMELGVDVEDCERRHRAESF
jgi:hypothetical protein